MRAIATAAIALAAIPAGAADADAQWYLQVDNDVVFTTDRWYSSGVRLARTARLQSGPALARDGLRPGGTLEQRVEWGLLQEIYTPESKRFRPGTIDRAPVGRLLASVARHDYAAAFHQTLEVDAGVRGPAARGRESIDVIHRLVPGPEVDWSRELPDRFDIQAAWVRSDRWALRTRWTSEGATHYGAVAGNNVSFVHAGFEVRTGDVSRAGFGPALRFAATPPLAAPGSTGWSGFLGASGRVVLHNEFLEHRPPLEPALDERRAILRLAAGLRWSAPWGVVTFAVVEDTREYRSQRRPHAFGTLSVHLAGF